MTHFSWIDGGIVGLYLLVTMSAGIAVRRYVGKVEQFLIAGREMNLYLGIASLAATEFGIVTCMYTAESGYKFGFAGATPGIMMFLAMLIVGYTGFCIKPLRDAGVITIPELFQQRFGSRVRWFAGVVIVLGGLLNMGVFLRVGGEFLLGVTGLAGEGYAIAIEEPDAEAGTALAPEVPAGNPQAAAVAPTTEPGPAPEPAGGLGAWVAAYKLELIMTALLLAVALYTILGGMLSVLVTDYLQFVVMSVGLILVSVLVLYGVGWSRLVDTVEAQHGVGGFNPFVHPDLGFFYVLFQLVHNTAAVLTWQTIIQRLLAAKDTRTGRQVYTRTSFFFMCRWLIPAVWGIAALAWLPVSLTGSEGFVPLHAMPIFLSTFVPIGVMGILVAAMLAADMSTDSSYMLTWGSVIYNDILAPFRRHWSDRRGLAWSRAIIALIGLFLLFYGLWYKFEGPVWDYLALTGTVYLASMSTLLIACCYWRGANSWGAAAAIAVGAVVPLAFLILEKQGGTGVADFVKNDIGPYMSGIIAYIGAWTAMVGGSLLKNLVKGAQTA